MPTLRQQRAIQKISDFIRNPSGKSCNFGQILKESGYSVSVSKKPHLVLSSPEFQKALNKALGDLGFQVKFQHLFLINQYDNLQVKAKAIDMYYKLTGKYQAVKIQSVYDEEIEEALTKIARLVPSTK